MAIVNPREILNYLTEEKGLSQSHALGIISNIKHESSFDPEIVNSIGATGLFQHLGERKDKLLAFTGGKLSDWRKQIDFALSEPEGQRYAKTQYESPREASMAFTMDFERPENKKQKAIERAQGLDGSDFESILAKFEKSTSSKSKSNGGYTLDDLRGFKTVGTSKENQKTPYTLDELRNFETVNSPKQEVEQPKPKVEKNNLKDFAIGVGQGVNQGLKMVTDVFGTDNAASQFLQDNIEGYQTQFSAGKKQQDIEDQKAREALGEDASFLDKAWLAMKQSTTNPAMIGQGVGQVLPMALGGVAGIGAKGMLALGAAQGAGSAKSNITDNILNAEESVLLENPDYAKMRETMDEKTAKQTLATKLQSYGENALLIAANAAIGAGMSRIGAEKFLGTIGDDAGLAALQEAAKSATAKGLASTTLKEVGTEVVQEPIDQLVGNLGAAKGGAAIDPTQGLAEAAGSAAAQSLLPSAGMSYIAGKSAQNRLNQIGNGQPDPQEQIIPRAPTRKQKQQEADTALNNISSATSVESAIAEAIKATDTPLEAIDASDLLDEGIVDEQILEDQNASQTTEQQVAGMVDDTSGVELDNQLGSATDLSLQSNNGGAGDIAETPTQGIAGDIPAGTGSEQDSALVDYSLLFDEQGKAKFASSQDVKDFKQNYGLGQDAVRIIQASVLDGKPISIQEAKEKEAEILKVRKEELKKSQSEEGKQAEQLKITEDFNRKQKERNDFVSSVGKIDDGIYSFGNEDDVKYKVKNGLVFTFDENGEKPYADLREGKVDDQGVTFATWIANGSEVTLPDGTKANEKLNKIAEIDDSEQLLTEKVGNADTLNESTISDTANVESAPVSEINEPLGNSEQLPTSDLQATSELPSSNLQDTTQQPTSRPIKEVVEQITQLRSSANELKKSSAFNLYLNLAKKLANGEKVNPSAFKKASEIFAPKSNLSKESERKFKILSKRKRLKKEQAEELAELTAVRKMVNGDADLSKYFKELEAIASQDTAYVEQLKAEESETKVKKEQEKLSVKAKFEASIKPYTDRVAQATDVDAINQIKRELNNDTTINDNQYEAIDNVIADRIDALSNQEVTADDNADEANAVDANESSVSYNQKPEISDEEKAKNDAIESIKADDSMSTAEKIKLAADLRRGNVSAEDVSAIVGSEVNSGVDVKTIEKGINDDIVNAENRRINNENKQRRKSGLEPLPFATSAKQTADGGFALEEVRESDVPLPFAKKIGIKLIAKAFGKKVIYIKDKNGRTLPFHGVYGASVGADENTIFLDYEDSPTILSVIGHEITHALRTQAPDIYDALESAITPFIDEELAKKQLVGRKYGTKEEVDNNWATQGSWLKEETIADMVGDRMSDPKFWIDVATKMTLQQSQKFFTSSLDVLNKALGVTKGGKLSTQDSTAIQSAHKSIVNAMATYKKRLDEGKIKGAELDGLVKQARKNAPVGDVSVTPYAIESIPVTVRYSIKQPETAKHGWNDRLNLATNKNGTVTVYYATDKNKARDIGRNRKIDVEQGQDFLLFSNDSDYLNKDNGDTAIVKVDVNPEILDVDQTFENGLMTYRVPVRGGELYTKKIQLWGMLHEADDPIVNSSMLEKFKQMAEEQGISDPSITDTVTINDLANLVSDSLNKYISMSSAEKRVALRNAKSVLKTQHNVTNFLTENGKLEKTRENDGLDKKVASLGLPLASAQQITEKLNTCPNSLSCKGVCLADKSGQNALYGGVGSWRKSVRLAQFLKTEAIVVHPEESAIILYEQIKAFERKAIANGYEPSIRLNVNSDFNPKVWEALFKALPNVSFYDYTKLDAKKIAPNHHLTYSSTGAQQVLPDGTVVDNPYQNWARMRRILDRGDNVAMAFTDKNELPTSLLDEETGKVYKVVNGDDYDYRPIDQTEEGFDGVIVGLKNKDNSLKREGITNAMVAKAGKGFFVYFDPAVHTDGQITIQRQPTKRTIPIKSVQYSRKQTETPEFKRWFGDSKVVDENGEPMVVYHGTDAEFSVFDYSKIGTNGRLEGAGFYFTNNKSVAQGYGNPIEAYLKIEKPMDYDQKPFSKPTLQKIIKRVAEIESERDGNSIGDGFLSNYGDVNYEGLDSVVREATNLIADDETAVDQLSGIVGSGVNPEVVNLATKEVTGFDGVVAKGFGNQGDKSNTIYVAFFPNQVKSATDNNGNFDPNNNDIRYARKDSPIFFSQLSKAIGEAKQDNWSGSAWNAWLKSNAPKLQIKKEELEWTGITDWLELQGKTKVSKADIQAYLDGNGVQVTETMLGDVNEYGSSEEDYYLAGEPDVYQNEDGTWTGVWFNNEQINDADTEQDAWNYLRRNANDGFEQERSSNQDALQPKYSGWKVEGGENYKELLLTLPPKKEKLTKYIVNISDGRSGWFSDKASAEKYAKKNKGTITEEFVYGLRDTFLYKSSHFDQPNILAHVRFDERTDADGNKVLFINEIQSDFGQDFKKAKDAINNAVDSDFNAIVERMKKAGVLEVNCD